MLREFACVLGSAILLAGSFPLAQAQFRSRALAVRVDVLVTNGRTPVAGLNAADFELRDNDVVQNIEVIETGGVPLNVVLALDTSASVEGKRYADLVAATHALLDGLSQADRAALIGFDHAVRPAVALTEDLALVRRQLDAIRPSGLTSIMDAVHVALAATLTQPGRSLVLVCTDGEDVSSWLTPADVLESAARSNAVVYAVSAGGRPMRALEQLTGATGGELLRVASTDGLRSAFERILRSFRNRYVLAYTPTGVAIGGRHRLDVRVKQRGLTATARPGYIGVEPGR